MNAKEQTDRLEILQKLRSLLDSDPTEEQVHQLFTELSLIFWRRGPLFNERFIQGILSKFPIAPDRIPDFTSVILNVRRSQMPSSVTFIELKRPSAKLYTDHGRMSKELNDAWMECVENARLMGLNFRDCLRRIVKTLDAKRLEQFEAFYASSANRENELDREFYSKEIPSCRSVIVIGRRSRLDSEGLLRTQELSASSGRTIQVVTYDTVIDALEEEPIGFVSRFFWYW